MRTPWPQKCRLDLAPPLADRFIVEVAPIDYGPILLLMPFGSHLTMDTLSSGVLQVVASGPPWLVSGFRFRARLGFVIPYTFSGPRGITPAFGYDAPHSSARGTLTLLNIALLSAHFRTQSDVQLEIVALGYQITVLQRKTPKCNLPKPESKRVWASLEKTPKEVIKEAFREARRRDFEGRKQWVALVDGSEPQLEILLKCFRDEGYHTMIVLDFIHVAERVWKAGMGFHGEGTKELEAWVIQRLLAILHGRCSQVALQECAAAPPYTA